ncbi:diacylglycerol kinase [Martelella endophytica]|uniref:Dihydrofolate reductase n=2 Tax=Martelella endophytica TaxID=1486262 RepID=A0A0D5LXR3_MAREN|nr:diacylglycerol kinase [Martelella endophytica]
MWIILVAAVSSNGVIGRDGGMPWRLSTDLKRFKAMTLGKPVIMGRKTFQSMGKALSGRTNIVISRDPDFAADGTIAVTCLADALDAARKAKGEADEIAIIGGGQIYAQAMAIADRLHITHVDAELDGDTIFPSIDDADWRVVSSEDVPAGEKDDYPTRYVVYERRGL